MAPDKTVGTERLPGRKKAKDRISLLFRCNADGSEKYEVMIIWRSFRHRVLKKGQERSSDLTITTIQRHR